jgi:hypothetical protein
MTSRGTSGTILPPHGAESLLDWATRQSNPSKPNVDNNAAIDAANMAIHDRLHGRSATSDDATTAPLSQLSAGHSLNHSRSTNADA